MKCKVCEEVKHILKNRDRYVEKELIGLIEERFSWEVN